MMIFMLAITLICTIKGTEAVKVVAQLPQGGAQQPSVAEMYRQQRAAQEAQQADTMKKLQVASLLKQTHTASLGFLFGGLIWRSLAGFEEAGLRRDGFMRTVSLPPALLLLMANVLGFGINIVKPQNFKSILKAVLALNIVREWTDMAYCLVMVLLRPWVKSKIPREVYFGRIVISLWWLTLCFGFSKSRWVSPSAAASGDAASSLGRGNRRPSPRRAAPASRASSQTFSRTYT